MRDYMISQILSSERLRHIIHVVPMRSWYAQYYRMVLYRNVSEYTYTGTWMILSATGTSNALWWYLKDRNPALAREARLLFRSLTPPPPGQWGKVTSDCDKPVLVGEDYQGDYPAWGYNL